MPDIEWQISTDNALTPRDIVKRLELAFSYVIVDEKLGMRYAAEKMLAARRSGEQEKADNLLAVLGDALDVIVTEDVQSNDAFLKLLLVPGQYPTVRFFSDVHQLKSATLLERCKAALK
jgi:hypothetical protein